MARPRISTAAHELSGAFDKDPKRKRARANEPLPNGPIGEPPACFDDHQRDLWTEVVALVPAGVLAKSDRLVLETVVRMLEKLRAGSIRGAELSILTSSLSRLGLTPADRSRVTVPGAKTDDGEQDDFAEFVARQNSVPTRAN